jgi:hypothetical protein
MVKMPREYPLSLSFGRWAQAFATDTETSDDREGAEQEGNFDEDLTSVEQVGLSVFQQGVGEDAVEEEKSGSGKRQIVQSAPDGTTDAMA